MAPYFILNKLPFLKYVEVNWSYVQCIHELKNWVTLLFTIDGIMCLISIRVDGQCQVRQGLLPLIAIIDISRPKM